MPAAIPEQHTLLCEACGYEVDGLPSHERCPECGRPVAASFPEVRTGSPWQRRPGALGLLDTWERVLVRPRQTFDTVSVVPDARGMLAINLALASLLIATLTGSLAWRINAPEHAAIPTWILWTGRAMLAGMTTFIVLGALTKVEELGIRFWGPRRGWRITPAIAHVVCAHASVGWVLGCVVALLGHTLGWSLAGYTNRHNVGILRGPMQLAPITLPVLGLVAGMLIFEVLVYIGMVRMRYANRPRTGG